jgi:hypothetical protein
MPILNPDHLLEQADYLTGTPAAGAPRQADLRRAISNAYYAIFHAIAAQAADDFFGRAQRANPLYSLVYRSIDHKILRAISEDIQKQTPPARYTPYIPAGGFGPDMVAVATAVVDLQEKRHSADYDPLFRVGTPDAVLTVDLARDAVTRFRGAHTSKRKPFLALLLFSPRK